MNSRTSPATCGGIFDLDRKEKRLTELLHQVENPELWSRPEELQKVNQEKSLIEKTLEDWRTLHQGLEDQLVLLEMASEEEDEAILSEVEQEIAALRARAEELELKRLLNGETDPNNVFLSIHAGAGGTEACDWASMLLRMYLRYAAEKDYKAEIVELTEGDEAGIKSVTVHIEGPYAYGHLKAESGVHRLVRISPFDSNARRHTSFSSVFAWPEVDESIDIEIRSEDLKVDTYRSGGAGGQHVNKTDSAVRITHLPSGIVVQCQSQRSQHANRDKAMKMLRAALYERELEERQKEKDLLGASKKANEWGSQIRSYVMHPYQMVKDHRTGYETSQVQSVMDGDLDHFIHAHLKQMIES